MADDVAEQISRAHLAWLRHDDQTEAICRTWAEWFEGYDVPRRAPGWQIIAPYRQDRRAIRVAELTAGVVGGYEVPPGFE